MAKRTRRPRPSAVRVPLGRPRLDGARVAVDPAILRGARAAADVTTAELRSALEDLGVRVSRSTLNDYERGSEPRALPAFLVSAIERALGARVRVASGAPTTARE